jgi:two-component system sensor histidine kinase VicK
MVYLVLVIILLVLVAFLAFRMNQYYRREASFDIQIKKLEKDFQKNNNQRKRAFASWDAFEDGVLILDQNDVVEYTNAQAEKFLGIPAKKILHKPITAIKDVENVSLVNSLLLPSHQYSFAREIEINDRLTVKISVHRLVSAKTYLGRMVMFSDVTRGKILEKTKMDFVALTAHQLNVPLSTTKLSLEMLLDGSLGKITAEQREIIKKTLERNCMLIDLVADLLDISKVGDHVHAYHWDLVNISKLIKSITSADSDELKNKNIALTINAPKASMPDIVLDKEKMFVAIKNLLDNAIRYTQEGGSIEITYGISGKQFEFSIKDSGIGIPETDKDQLFNRFFRAKNAVKFESTGSGLGLFIVKDIIEAHHGKIWFESAENKGSTFSFSLPAREVE